MITWHSEGLPGDTECGFWSLCPPLYLHSCTCWEEVRNKSPGELLRRYVRCLSPSLSRLRNKRIIYINWKNPSCSEAFPTLSTHQQSTHSLWVSVWDWGRGPGNHFLFSYSCLQKPRQPVRHTHLWGSSTYGDEEEGLRGRVIQSTAPRTP